MNLIRSKLLATAWLLIITVLFLLPGSAFPEDNWLKSAHIDKWVHVILFAVLVFLFATAFASRRKAGLVLLLAVVYGFLVEVIQNEWIPNRSFDMLDLISDAAGSLIGCGIWLRLNRQVEKNKPL